MIPAANDPMQSYTMNHTDGVQSRGGQTYLVVHHARMYPAAPNNCWVIPSVDERLPLELAPSSRDGKLTVRVLWLGERQAAAEITADLAGGKRIEGRADGSGDFTVEASEPGRYTFRSEQAEKVAGERDGKKYTSILHRTTLVVLIVREGTGGLANLHSAPAAKVADATQAIQR